MKVRIRTFDFDCENKRYVRLIFEIFNEGSDIVKIGSFKQSFGFDSQFFYSVSNPSDQHIIEYFDGYVSTSRWLVSPDLSDSHEEYWNELYDLSEYNHVRFSGRLNRENISFLIDPNQWRTMAILTLKILPVDYREEDCLRLKLVDEHITDFPEYNETFFSPYNGYSPIDYSLSNDDFTFMKYNISSFEGIDEPPFCISEVCQDSEIGLDLCSDGIDNDGDGLVDCADDECQLSQGTFTIGITVNGTSTCDADQGEVIITVPADFSYDDYSICIDDNCADPATGIISNIPIGTYDIVMKDLNGCEVPFQVTPENTDALCSDGIDNDGDGYADCDDLDCIFLNINSFKSDNLTKNNFCLDFSPEEALLLSTNEDLIKNYFDSEEELLLVLEILKIAEKEMHFQDYECTTRNDVFDQEGNYLRTDEEGDGLIIINVNGIENSYSSNKSLLNDRAHGRIIEYYVLEVCPNDIVGQCNLVQGLGINYQDTPGFMEVYSLVDEEYKNNGKRCLVDIGIRISFYGTDQSPIGNIELEALESIDSYKSFLLHELNHLFGQYDQPQGNSCRLNFDNMESYEHVIIYYNQLNAPYWSCVPENGKTAAYLAIVQNFEEIIGKNVRAYVFENYMSDFGDIDFWKRYGLKNIK